MQDTIAFNANHFHVKGLGAVSATIIMMSEMMIARRFDITFLQCESASSFYCKLVLPFSSYSHNTLVYLCS